MLVSTTDSTQNPTTYYVYDAGGNLMASYKKQFSNNTTYSYTLTEEYMYGLDRIGDYQNGNVVYNGGAQTTSLTKALLNLELSDHLGNVRGVVTGARTGTAATLVSLADYYPFGMQMAQRNLSPVNYRFGFNGKEKDSEPYGEGNEYDYGFRMYDPRIGRFQSVDPLSDNYPMLTPYQYASLSPIQFIDIDGLEGGKPKGPGQNLQSKKQKFGSSGSGGGGSFLSGFGDGLKKVLDATSKYGTQWIQNQQASSNLANNEVQKMMESSGSGNSGPLPCLTCPCPTCPPPYLQDNPFNGLSDGNPGDYGQYLAWDIANIFDQLNYEEPLAGNQHGGSPWIPFEGPINKGVDVSFKSFSALKKYLGRAGDSRAWHHIVEQTPANVRRFGQALIQNTKNMANLAHGKGSIHNRISGYFSSKRSFTFLNGKQVTVREWLSSQSFDDQFKFGIDVLKKSINGEALPR
jgi:RHS repeat-associated protein